MNPNKIARNIIIPKTIVSLFGTNETYITTIEKNITYVEQINYAFNVQFVQLLQAKTAMFPIQKKIPFKKIEEQVLDYLQEHFKNTIISIDLTTNMSKKHVKEILRIENIPFKQELINIITDEKKDLTPHHSQYYGQTYSQKLSKILNINYEVPITQPYYSF